MIKSSALKLTILLLFLSIGLFAKVIHCPIDSVIAKIDQEAPMGLLSALDAESISSDYLFETLDTACVIKLYRKYINSNGGKGFYYLVLDDLWQALLLADKANLYDEKFYLYKDIARFCGYLKRFEEAEEYFEEANKYRKYAALNKKEITRYYAALSHFYIHKGDLKLAKLYIDSCYQLRSQLNMKKSYFLEHRKALIARKEGRFEQALQLINEAIQNLKTKKPAFLGVLYADLGDTYYMLGQYPESKNNYLLAKETILTLNKHIDHLPRIYGRLAKLNQLQGNFEEAYKMSKKQNQLDRKFFDSRFGINKELLQIQNNFQEYKRKEETKIKKLELERLSQDQRLLLFQRLLLLASIFFLSTLAIIYFRIQKKKIIAEKELNQNLYEQNLEKQDLLNRIEQKNESLLTFSNIMSHDLKAPLRNITSFSSLIKRQLKKGLDQDKISEFNDFVINSANSMQILIEDLLMYFRVDTENQNLTQIDLNDLIDTVLSSFSYDINSENVTINIDTLPQVSGNKDLLKTVFHNLISNAIKYQPKSAEGHRPAIDFRAVKNEDTYHLFVKDNGIGIKGDFEKKIFESFTRYHSASEYEGTGLGLSICKKIMQKHKGDIIIEETSNAGSTFKLIFPVLE